MGPLLRGGLDFERAFECVCASTNQANEAAGAQQADTPPGALAVLCEHGRGCVGPTQVYDIAGIAGGATMWLNALEYFLGIYVEGESAKAFDRC